MKADKSSLKLQVGLVTRRDKLEISVLLCITQDTVAFHFRLKVNVDGELKTMEWYIY